MTAEVAPPVACDAQELLRKATPLRGLADAVNVTDGAGARAHMSALAAATFLLDAGIEPILQMTCRDRNRIALQSDLMGAAALDIHNILVLTGDDPKAGDQPDTKPVFDVDSKTLIETARRLRDEGKLPTGREVVGKAAFFPRRGRYADRSAGRLAAELAARKTRRRRPIRADPILHGRRHCAPLGRRAGESRADQRPGHPHRHQSAAVRQVRAVDAEPSVRHHHSR